MGRTNILLIIVMFRWMNQEAAVSVSC